MRRTEVIDRRAEELQLKQRLSGIVRGIKRIQELKDNSIGKGKAGVIPDEGISHFEVGKDQTGQPVYTAKIKAGDILRTLEFEELKGYGFVYNYEEKRPIEADNTGNGSADANKGLTPAILDDFDRVIKREISVRNAWLHRSSKGTSGV